MSFSTQLIRWYRKNKRDLPWRETTDPYQIWLSEIILQQTRVEQGLPYFLKYIKAYPTLADFAQAPEDEILKYWQGLGYYSRARNMLNTARQLIKLYQGKFPKKYEELILLKGIGPYTAAAIASFAFNQAVPVVDGNVFRVLSRFLGIYEPINSSVARKLFTKAAFELLDKKNPSEFNQAIMEFGATLCKPAKPDCDNCPISSSCFAFAKNKIAELPVKTPKTKQRIRYFNYIHFTKNGSTFLKKRGPKDIWQGLYEFPLIETQKAINPEELFDHPDFIAWTQKTKIKLINWQSAKKHILSHQIIYARFWQIEVMKGNLKPDKSTIIVSEERLAAYPVPRILDIYLKKINLV
ncbi:MAG: A/G-specific adenine glycosylase [Bacteroidia bacterium]|nr:A/G-specific adenine glycosylase [Bacteroidia bacterium]